MARCWRRSSNHGAERPLPDLFCFALVGLFGGYFPGYSSLAVTKPNYLTWAILKAHTENRAGEVVLRSADPRDTPLINFHYFEEGSDKAGEDLNSVVAGIRFVRKLTAKAQSRRCDCRRGTAGRGAPKRRRTEGLCAQHGVGPSCVLHLPDRAARRRRRAQRRLPGARHPRAARRRRVGVSAYSGFFHRQRRIHGCRESGRRDPGDPLGDPLGDQ